jgi:hypothetical protein
MKHMTQITQIAISLRMLQILTLFVLAFVAQPCSAWNRTGHFIAAAIAYDLLERSSPNRLAALDALLREHPAAKDWQTWESDYPQLAPAKMRFMLASVWPDDARRGQYKAFDRPDWHYVNFPVRPGEPLVDIRRAAPLTGKGIDALTTQLSVIHDSEAPLAKKAVALSWVLHLVADLAQPLHVGTLVNAQFPDGDRGGNDVYVRASERASAPVRLHQVWDDAAGGTSVDMQRAAARARAWASEAPGEVKDLAAFIERSYRLAGEVAYRDGRLGYAIAGQSDAPVLPLGYLQTLETVAREQIILAGHFAARLLVCNQDEAPPRPRVTEGIVAR